MSATMFWRIWSIPGTECCCERGIGDVERFLVGELIVVLADLCAPLIVKPHDSFRTYISGSSSNGPLLEGLITAA
jgi:hypothetical protein